jgi:hypothetical protein
MARETAAPPPSATPDADAPAPAPAQRRRGTQTTATAPLGRPVVEPIVEQITEDEGTAELDRPTADYLADREWLYDQLQHRAKCPMIAAPFSHPDADDVAADVRANARGLDAGEVRVAVQQALRDLGPTRSDRMEHHDATEPRNAQNPTPRTYRIIQCNDCGARARIPLPRVD